MDDTEIPAIRSMGFRKVGRRNVPLVHAKLALLGDLWWHDEGPIGNVEDVIGFRAERLWISSANFTRSSRRHLEFGYWTDDVALMVGVRRFLLSLIAASEDIDSDADAFDPDLADVEFDDDAMREAMADLTDDEDD